MSNVEVRHYEGVALSSSASRNGLAFNSHQTWAFWRAGAKAFSESPFRCDNGERATFGHQTTLPPRLYGAERMRVLAIEALEELLPTLNALPTGSTITAMVAIGERFGNQARKADRAEAEELKATLGAFFQDGGRSVEVTFEPRGHAGFAHVLRAAAERVLADDRAIVIVGGLDTYYDPVVVQRLLHQRRLFDLVDYHRIIPGEAATFFVLASERLCARADLRVFARLDAAATGSESASMFSGQPSLGRGMTAVLRAATERLRERRGVLDWILGDLTHEDYRMQEISLALPRLLAPAGLDDAGASFRMLCTPDLRTDFPAAAFGDLGAASMPTLSLLAAQSFVRGQPHAQNCLVFGSSTTADRGAILLRRGPN